MFLDKVYRFFTALIIIIVLASASALAHSHKLTGKVTVKGKSGEPVIGATVRVKNSVIGSNTNSQGEFNMKNCPDGKLTLIVTAVGMKPVETSVELTHGKEADKIAVEMEESSITTGSVVVTATRSEKIYEDVPVKVAVLDDKIFQATQSLNLKEGLSFRPGLRVETNCQNCGFSQVRMNGLEGHYSQILLDSKPIFSALNGVYGLDQIPANMVDRIEIVRGGGSALYGSNAIAGVINIITKEPYSNSVNVGVNREYIDGTIPEFNIRFGSTFINEAQDVGLFIFGTNRERNSFDANGDGFTEISTLDVKNFGGRIFYKPSPFAKLSVEYHNIYHETRGGDSLEKPAHETLITEMTKHLTNVGQVSYEQYFNGQADKLSGYLSVQNTDRNSYYGAGKDPNAYGSTKNETYASGVQFNHYITESDYGSHVMTFGYEYSRDWIKDIALGYNRVINQTTQNHAVYLQDDWEFYESLDLVFGGRFDKNNHIDNVIFSPRVNLLYRLTDNISLRGNFSTGFRAPQAFDEDLHITQVGGTGMVLKLGDNLKPEYSKSYGLSLDYNDKILDMPFSVSVEYFQTRLTDVFVLTDGGSDAKGNTIMVRENGKGSKVYGSTIELRFAPIEEIDLSGGFTVQQALLDAPVKWSVGDANKGIEPQYYDKLMRSPELYGYFTLTMNPWKALGISLSGVYTGPMYVPHYAGYIEKDVLKKTESFIEINTNVSLQIIENPNISLVLGVQNVGNAYQDDFDKGQYRDSGYVYGPSRPRTFFFGLKSSF